MPQVAVRNCGRWALASGRRRNCGRWALASSHHRSWAVAKRDATARAVATSPTARRPPRPSPDAHDGGAADASARVGAGDATHGHALPMARVEAITQYAIEVERTENVSVRRALQLRGGRGSCSCSGKHLGIRGKFVAWATSKRHDTTATANPKPRMLPQTATAPACVCVCACVCV